MGREPILWGRMASRNRATGAFLHKQKGDGQQQGNRGISALAERGRTVAGWQGHFCVSRKGTDSKAEGAECRSRKGRKANRAAWAECRSRKGRKANRAAFEGRVPKQKGAEGKQGSIRGQSAEAKRGRQANRAAFEGRVPKQERAAGLKKKAFQKTAFFCLQKQRPFFRPQAIM